MVKAENIGIEIIDIESGFIVESPRVWQKLREYLNGKIDNIEFDKELKLYIFEKIINESKLEAEEFYHQHKKRIDKDTGRKAIFLKHYGIKDFNKFKKSLKEEYPDIFYDENFRFNIIKEQNYICGVCGTDLKDVNAHLHHIDYNKQNCRKDNLVFLCPRCHGKTNFERHFWKEILQEYKETHETVTGN